MIFYYDFKILLNPELFRKFVEFSIYFLLLFYLHFLVYFQYLNTVVKRGHRKNIQWNNSPWCDENYKVKIEELDANPAETGRAQHESTAQLLTWAQFLLVSVWLLCKVLFICTFSNRLVVLVHPCRLNSSFHPAYQY